MDIKFDKKVFIVANITLSIVAIFLILNLFGLSITNIGQALAVFDLEDERCLVKTDTSLSANLDIDRCCLMAKAQISCDFNQKKVMGENYDWVCSSEGSQVEYWFNKKGLNYCHGQPYW
mgnify:FL=1|jgi:hypothetical protein